MVEAHDESYSIHVENLGDDLKATLSDELIEQYRQKYTLKKPDRISSSEMSTAVPAPATV